MECATNLGMIMFLTGGEGSAIMEGPPHAKAHKEVTQCKLSRHRCVGEHFAKVLNSAKP